MPYGIPWSIFFRRDSAALILAFILLYKDRRHHGRRHRDAVLPRAGFFQVRDRRRCETLRRLGTIAGAVAGGMLMLRLGIHRSLWFSAYCRRYPQRDLPFSPASATAFPRFPG